MEKSAKIQMGEVKVMDATIKQLQTAMEANQLTSKDLTTIYLKRIEAYDRQGPEIRAMLHINPNALEEAEKLDEERKQKGSRGLLHGIPIIIKDNYGTKDMPTTCGTNALKDFFPCDDSYVVKVLRKAGAIILGKTNLHELALFGLTCSSLGGQTRNPYDLTRTPGGSSGGTGAGVSANFAVAGTGTDAVNSIRSPASANNLAGIRPTKGSVNLEGIMPVSFTQDTAGPIARTIEDAAIVLEVMSEKVGAYSKSLDPHGLSGKRIGVLLNLFGKEKIHEEVNFIMDTAVKDIQALGAQIVTLTLPQFDSNELLKDLDVQRFEMKQQLDQYFSTYKAPVQSFEELANAVNYDLSLKTLLSEVLSLERPLTHPEYLNRLGKIESLKKRILKVMDEKQLDAFLYPHQKRLVVGIDEDSQADRNGIVAALTGFPAITFQGGFSKPTETADYGIPIGIELLGRPYQEDQLISMVYAFEKAINHRKMPPSTP